jgi:probable F420-dependent oxidoreductase
MHAPEGQHSYARVIAALGPQMLQLGGERADGVHTYLVDVTHTATARSLVGDKFIAVEQAVVLGGTREEYLRRAHTYLEFYTGLENYRANWRRMGFGDDDFVRGGSDRLCEAMVIHGDADDIIGSIRDHQAAGANHVCLQVLGQTESQAPLEDWQRIASALGLS